MADLTDWNVEDDAFWESKGKRIANRNLWISIPSLLLGFAIWLFWGIITVEMKNLGFQFDFSQLFTISAIAGLTGATLRIPSTFMIRVAGGRNTIFFTTSLLLLPAFGAGIALTDPTTPLIVFQFLALLSGFGGGNFASSMSNISFFFPKRVQGTSLGLNAGLGNFGVTTMQMVVPFVMTFALFGPLGGDPVIGLAGFKKAGVSSYIQNAGFVWVPVLVVLGIAGFFGMNNIVTEDVSPNYGNTFTACIKISIFLIVGFITSIFGLWLLLYVGVTKWVVLPVVIFLTVFILRMIPGPTKPILKRTYKIFNNKQTWVMTVIYTMTFGSFIGYSAAVPLSIKVVFGYMHDAAGNNIGMNPNSPTVFAWAWMGPFVGALIRPVGGWMSDKLGGAVVTEWITIIMIFAALGVAYYMNAAYHVQNPEIYFPQFMVLLIILFAGTGIGNGSTFRSIAVMFNREQAGPVLAWTSAVAAYGAFLIPKILGEQTKAGTPEYALYGFAVFYFICLILNWWYYTRRGSLIKC